MTAFVAAVGSYASLNADTPVEPSVPDGVKSGSLVFLVGVVFSTTVGLSTPAGFTLLASYTADRPRVYLWWKRATGNESGTYSVSTTASNAAYRTAQAFRIAGDDGSGTPFRAQTLAQNPSSSSSSASVSLTATLNDLLLWGVGVPSAIVTAPSGYIEQTDDTTAKRIHLATKTHPATGSTGGQVGTFDAPAVDNTAFLVAVKSDLLDLRFKKPDNSVVQPPDYRFMKSDGTVVSPESLLFKKTDGTVVTL